MKLRYTLALATPLASAIMFAQSSSYTYTGNIVNANCYQATAIVNRNSRGYAPKEGANAFAEASRKAVPNASPRKKKEILRHCSINPGSTAFALLSDDGNFLKLDEKGNAEAESHVTVSRPSPSSGAKKIRVSVTGSVDRETLKVLSLSKM